MSFLVPQIRVAIDDKEGHRKPDRCSTLDAGPGGAAMAEEHVRTRSHDQSERVLVRATATCLIINQEGR